MVKTKAWKDFPGAQVSEDSLWEMTKKYNSFLNKNHGLTISTDPLNLTGINTKRDSGVSAVRALGIETEVNERTVKEKKQKKKAQVVRFNLNIKTKKKLPKKRLVALKDKEEPTNNNVVYGSNKNVTLRAIVKSLKRDLKNYRKDLVPVAFRKLKKLSAYKLKNKWTNRTEAKKIKA
jgi:hypothetical protein